MTATTARLKVLPGRALSALDSAIDLDEVRKPAMAVVGVADLAVAQAKEAQASLSARAAAVPATVKGLPTRMTHLRETLPAQVTTLRSSVSGRATTAQTKTTQTFDGLVTRGEKLVTSIRRQKATRTAVDEGTTAVKKAEAAGRNAKRSAKATVEAVEAAADKLG